MPNPWESSFLQPKSTLNQSCRSKSHAAATTHRCNAASATVQLASLDFTTNVRSSPRVSTEIGEARTKLKFSRGPLSVSPSHRTRVVDGKTPGSGEEHRNRYEQLALLRPEEQIKFVLCDRADYDWSRSKLASLQLTQRCQVLFSPSHEQLPARQLADWILADRLPVRFQIQLHKYLWGNEPGR